MNIDKKPLDWFKEDPSNLRKSFDLEELRLLNSTLRIRQWVPCIARRDGTMIDGHYRLRAAKLGGVDTLEVVIVEGDISAGEVKEIQLITSLQKEGLKPYEVALGCKAWMDANQEAKAQDLAARIGRNPSYVSKVLSLWRCIPVVQEAAQAGRVGISDWSAIATVSEQEQHALLEAKLNGATRDELEHKSRKARNDDQPVVRSSRIVCPLPSGVTITFSGKELTLEEALEAMQQELFKDMKKAAEQGLDGKTFSAMCKDKAKKGA
jgi:ParB/RepB/Spo0J family partition protein